MNKKALAKKYNDTRERKETRQLLWRWGHVADYCKRTNAEISFFQERVSEVSCLRARAEIKVDGGKQSDPTAQSAEDLEKLQESYAKCVTDGTKAVESEIAFKKLMDEIMDGVSPEDRELLTMRYKNGWSWIMVASKLNITVEGATKRERKVIAQIYKKIQVNQKSTEK